MTMEKRCGVLNVASFLQPVIEENPAGFKELDVEDKYRDMMIFPQDGDTIDVGGGEI